MNLSDIEKEIARRSFLDFITYTMPTFEVSDHHIIFADAIEKFISREYKNLIISCPPRHGKSEMVSRRLPAYLFGKDPNTAIITSSYSADLAGRMNRDVQRIIDHELYSELFPNTKLNSKNVRTDSKNNYVRNSDMFEIVGHKGVYRSTGVGGGITGMGARFGIIDDPIKDHEEANSPRMRQKIWDWYTSTLLTRIEGDGGVLICQTRWHTDDLVGRLENDPNFVVINLPAINSKGEALWPERYDIDFLKQRKKDLGTKNFESLYQQSPILDGGNIIKRESIRVEKAWPNCKQYIQSWDLTFKGNKSSDYVVGQVWGQFGADYHLIDQVRGQWDFVRTLSEIRKLTKRYPKALTKLIEDKANGPAVIASLKKEIPGIIPINPKAGKVERLHMVSPLFEAGNVVISDELQGLDEFISETISFPNSKHDDQVDAMTQALQYLFSKQGQTFATSGRSMIGRESSEPSIFNIK